MLICLCLKLYLNKHACEEEKDFASSLWLAHVFPPHISQWHRRARADGGGEHEEAYHLLQVNTVASPGSNVQFGDFWEKDLQNSWFGKMPNEQVITWKFNPRLNSHLTFTISISGKTRKKLPQSFTWRKIQRSLLFFMFYIIIC